MLRYSRKLSREKSFTNFEVLWLFAKVWIIFSTNLQKFSAIQYQNLYWTGQETSCQIVGIDIIQHHSNITNWENQQHAYNLAPEKKPNTNDSSSSSVFILIKNSQWSSCCGCYFCICVSGTVGPRADGDTGQLDAWTSGFCTPSVFSSVAVEANNMHICLGTVDQSDWIY